MARIARERLAFPRARTTRAKDAKGRTAKGRKARRAKADAVEARGSKLDRVVLVVNGHWLVGSNKSWFIFNFF